MQNGSLHDYFGQVTKYKSSSSKEGSVGHGLQDEP